MKRRRFIQALAAVPAAPALVQQPPAPAAAPAQTQTSAITYGHAEDFAQPLAGFFTQPQLAALQRLGDVLMPPAGNEPGATQCHAAEFLDFLVKNSPAERQQLYRAGLDALNAQARRQFNRTFAETDAAQADALMAPLKKPWSYEPADPLEKFLRAVYPDIQNATRNSREWAAITGMTRNISYLRPLD